MLCLFCVRSMQLSTQHSGRRALVLGEQAETSNKRPCLVPVSFLGFNVLLLSQLVLLQSVCLPNLRKVREAVSKSPLPSSHERGRRQPTAPNCWACGACRNCIRQNCCEGQASQPRPDPQSFSKQTHTGYILRGTRTLLGAPGLTTRNKDATRGSWPYYEEQGRY